MNCDHPLTSTNDRKAVFAEERAVAASPSRLLDEKISDESCTETNSDSALKPAGLSNPFWK